jgi:hypothetical protein
VELHAEKQGDRKKTRMETSAGTRWIIGGRGRSVKPLFDEIFAEFNETSVCNRAKKAALAGRPFRGL